MQAAHYFPTEPIAPPSLLLRLRVIWRRGQLDRRLAAGDDPACDPALAARAGQLCSRKVGRSLAAAFIGIVEMAHELPTAHESPRLDRGEILYNRELLLELVGRLKRPGPLDPAGVALAQELLRDRTGPLYLGDRGRLLLEDSGMSLTRHLRRVTAALDGA
jgi:hypothetical protein